MNRILTGKRSRQAYDEMLENVVKTQGSSEKQADVIQHLPTYGEVRCQLSSHRRVRCTPIPDPLNLPDELRTTLRGRQVNDEDINKNEPFLIHEAQQGNIHLLQFLLTKSI